MISVKTDTKFSFITPLIFSTPIKIVEVVVETDTNPVVILSTIARCGFIEYFVKTDLS